MAVGTRARSFHGKTQMCDESCQNGMHSLAYHGVYCDNEVSITSQMAEKCKLEVYAFWAYLFHGQQLRCGNSTLVTIF